MMSDLWYSYWYTHAIEWMCAGLISTLFLISFGCYIIVEMYRAKRRPR
jgi:hypothetical protein